MNTDVPMSQCQSPQGSCVWFCPLIWRHRSCPTWTGCQESLPKLDTLGEGEQGGSWLQETVWVLETGQTWRRLLLQALSTRQSHVFICVTLLSGQGEGREEPPLGRERRQRDTKSRSPQGIWVDLDLMAALGVPFLNPVWESPGCVAV